MKEIKWTGPEREIPGFGIMKTGDTKQVSDRVAESLIYQGLAVAVRRKEEAKK